MQRRALESVIGGSFIQISSKKTYWMEDREIFFWGVSEGYGTCSDIHDLSIGVFGFERSNQSLKIECILYFAAIDTQIDGPERAVRKIMPMAVTEDRVYFEYSGDEVTYKKI